MRKQEIYQELKSNPKNVRFERLCRAAESFGFTFKRMRGSHRVYKREGIVELLDFQHWQSMGKSYQVKQFLEVIDDYNLLEE